MSTTTLRREGDTAETLPERIVVLRFPCKGANEEECVFDFMRATGMQNKSWTFDVLPAGEDMRREMQANGSKSVCVQEHANGEVSFEVY